MVRFDHERLDVYRVGLGFIVQSTGLINGLPPGHGYLADQLRRAALSITLNTAEGAGEFAPVEKARFYRMARRSATECAAILDVMRALAVADTAAIEDGHECLAKIVSMLIKLGKVHER